MDGTADFLEARDARLRELERTLEQAATSGSILFISTKVPGPLKFRPGVARLLQGALERLHRAIGLQVLASGGDILGPYYLASSRVPPMAAKQAAMAIEAEGPSGKLLDLDVYQPQGREISRAGLRLPRRSCLLCDEPARKCMLLRRHSITELLDQVDRLLVPWAQPPGQSASPVPRERPESGQVIRLQRPSPHPAKASAWIQALSLPSGGAETHTQGACP
jgi:holo-ACP synthase CitX